MEYNAASYRPVLGSVKRPFMKISFNSIASVAILCGSFQFIDCGYGFLQLSNSLKLPSAVCRSACKFLVFRYSFFYIPQRLELETFVVTVQFLSKTYLHLSVGLQEVIEKILLYVFSNRCVYKKEKIGEKVMAKRSLSCTCRFWPSRIHVACVCCCGF